jgi:mannose-6-phosphate isomerase-like protein (cupin superfamily)
MLKLGASLTDREDYEAASIAYHQVLRGRGVRDAEVYQQVWIVEGTMEMTVGDVHWRLAAGDCLAMQLDRPIVFHNPTQRPARYLVALTTVASVGWRTK